MVYKMTMLFSCLVNWVGQWSDG